MCSRRLSRIIRMLSAPLAVAFLVILYRESQYNKIYGQQERDFMSLHSKIHKIYIDGYKIWKFDFFLLKIFEILDFWSVNIIFQIKNGDFEIKNYENFDCKKPNFFISYRSSHSKEEMPSSKIMLTDLAPSSDLVWVL